MKSKIQTITVLAPIPGLKVGTVLYPTDKDGNQSSLKVLEIDGAGTTITCRPTRLWETTRGQGLIALVVIVLMGLAAALMARGVHAQSLEMFGPYFPVPACLYTGDCPQPATEPVPAAAEKFYEYVPPDWRPPTHLEKECTGRAMLPPFDCEVWEEVEVPDTWLSCNDPRWWCGTFTTTADLVIHAYKPRDAEIEMAKDGSFTFYSKGKARLRFEANGKVFVDGKPVKAETSMAQGFRKWLC